MHLYWRIIEELKFIGETWIFSDPSLARNFQRWIHKNSDAIDMLDRAEIFRGPTLFTLNGLPHSMN